MMTESDIKKSISKHSVKPIMGLVILMVALKVLNVVFFDNDPVSPILVALFAVAGCIYTFEKVLVDLLVKSKTEVTEE